MELTSKQRACLRSMANPLPVILYIGKEGVTQGTIKEAYDALNARELIKCQVQPNAPEDAKACCSALCGVLGASPVQVIGARFVLYRRNDKNPIIDLP